MNKLCPVYFGVAIQFEDFERGLVMAWPSLSLEHKEALRRSLSRVARLTEGQFRLGLAYYQRMDALNEADDKQEAEWAAEWAAEDKAEAEALKAEAEALL